MKVAVYPGSFDPLTNARYAARFLNELYAPRNDWSRAASAYHSATAEHAEPYRQRVMAAWTEEMARFFFIWMVMLGAMIGVREGTHFEVDVFPTLSWRANIVLRLVSMVFVLVFALAQGLFWIGKPGRRPGSAGTARTPPCCPCKSAHSFSWENSS
mgnify:CR=1 FL=1